jgi:hypothetical protein
MGRMWMGPAIFVAASVFLWQYLGSVFIPNLVTRSVVRALQIPEDMQIVVVINAYLFYFGAYFLFAMFWPRLKFYFRNPFVAGMALWMVNVLVIFPLIGRGVLGYRLPQGWISASFPLLLSHWLFARGIQFQMQSRHEARPSI